MKRFFITFILFSGFIASPCISIGWGAEINIPSLKGKAGQSIDVPVMIDKVDNLAGVKLVLAYDPKILQFKKGTKTSQTDALMHIVNDKNRDC
jgi:hypothetical protein